MGFAVSVSDGPPKILGRSRRLLTDQREVFDRIFHSGGGGVLDFSIRTMTEWFEERFGLKVFQERFQVDGGSKGKTLRGFVEVAEPHLVADVLRELWAYRIQRPDFAEDNDEQEARLKAWLEQFAEELESASSLNLDEAVKDFSGDTSLPKLRASIAADLTAENPDVALDRVHTYCVKRYRNLLAARGQHLTNRTPLEAIFGAYGRMLRDDNAVSDIALPPLRIQHKLFECLNNARNKRSLAHDNELLDVSEAQFIIDSVLASLGFIERLESRNDDSSGR